MTRKKELGADDLVGLLASHLRGVVLHGETISGVVCYGELDVEITMRARTRVARDQTEEWRRQAYDLIETGGSWLDSCCVSVKDRGRFNFTRNKTTGCKKPITFAVVCRSWKDEATISFRCSIHKDHHGRDAKAVLATIPLTKTGLESARKRGVERAREAAEYASLTEVERVAWDRRKLGDLAGAKQIEIEDGERTCVRNACENPRCRCKACTPRPFTPRPACTWTTGDPPVPCDRLAEYECSNASPTCRQHKSSCCRPFPEVTCTCRVAQQAKRSA